MKKKKNKAENGSETIKRIGSDFIAEIEEIKKYVSTEKGVKVSLPKLTDKLIKHEKWNEIKEALKNFAWPKNEK